MKGIDLKDNMQALILAVEYQEKVDSNKVLKTLNFMEQKTQKGTTKQERDKIRQLKKQGYTYRKIRDMTGRSILTIQTILKGGN